MKVFFEKKFLKDINALNSREIKKRIEEIIIALETANDLSKITNLKKMKGHPTAYRIRFGEYRLALFFEKGAVILVRFMHRKDIYKYFPPSG